MGSTEIEARLRQLVGEVPGPESVIFSSSLFSAGNAIEIELASDQFEQLPLAVERLKEQIAQYAGTGDIQDSFEEGKLRMKPSQTPGAHAGHHPIRSGTPGASGLFGDQSALSAGFRRCPRYGALSAERTPHHGDVRAMRVRTTGAEVPFDEVPARSGTRIFHYPAHRRPAGRCIA